MDKRVSKRIFNPCIYEIYSRNEVDENMNFLVSSPHIYVGKANNFESRKKQHIKAFKDGQVKRKLYSWLKSLNSIDEVIFAVSKIFETEEEAYLWEKEQIKLRKEQGFSLLNLTDGGDGFTSEVISRINRKRYSDPNERLKDSIRVKKFYKDNPDAREKASIAAKNRYKSDPIHGILVSESNKKRWSIPGNRRKQSINNPKRKPVICLNDNRFYRSQNEAGKNYSVGHVGEICQGKFDSSKGYRFKYASFSRPIVFCNGCWDLLHPGHVSLLKKASEIYDTGTLIVAMNSDESIRQIKGLDRPIIDEVNRFLMLNSLSCVDEVIIFDEDTPTKLIEEIKPDVIVKGPDYLGKEQEVIGSELSEIRIIKSDIDISTSKIIEKIKNL